jgi:Pyruvate/2-oxoacid:ferredoxin oxidoreductase delta subunit
VKQRIGLRSAVLPMESPTFSRREALFGMFRRAAPRDSAGPPAAATAVVAPAVTSEARVAVVQGRRCLAYRTLACSVCAERCPEPGALVREVGLPRVVADLCTGCGVCRDVCPAPGNAILIVGRRMQSTKGGCA